MDAIHATIGRSSFWIATVAAAGLALLPPPAGDVPNKVYRNPEHKFSLKVFADWDQVPIEGAAQQWEIVKFYLPGERGERVQQELQVFRVPKNAARAPTTGGSAKSEKEAREAAQAAMEAAMAPKSVFELAYGRLRIPEGQKPPDPNSFKKIVSGDKVEGKLYAHEVWLGPPGFSQKDKTWAYFGALAAFEKDGIEYGIHLQGPASRRKDLEHAIQTMGKSFLFFDDKAKENEVAAGLLDGVDISPKRRLQIQRGLIKGWGLEVSPKKNYVILYNTKGNKNKQLAKFIAERIEKIREQTYEVQFPPAQPIKAVSIVRICGDRTEYHAYGGPGGSAGYWNSGAEELVFYDASPARKVDDDTLAVLYHEAFHQYIYYSVGNVAPHSWFNEGHGDYYAGARFRGSRCSIEPFDWRIGTVKTAITEGPRPFTVEKDEKTGKERKIWGDKGYTPLKDLVAFSQAEYYSYPGVSYAQGWSLVYFLREGVPKKKAWNEKWGKILDKYFDALKREVAKEGKLVRGGEGPEQPGPDEPGDPPEPTGPEPEEPPEPKEPEPGEGEGEEAPPDPGFGVEPEGYASESALETALREAFEGVDFAELEAAWLEFTKKVS